MEWEDLLKFGLKPDALKALRGVIIDEIDNRMETTCHYCLKSHAFDPQPREFKFRASRQHAHAKSETPEKFTCSQCGKRLSIELAARDGKTRDGRIKYLDTCKSCMSSKNRIRSWELHGESVLYVLSRGDTSIRSLSLAIGVTETYISSMIEVGIAQGELFVVGGSGRDRVISMNDPGNQSYQ
jgi:hypothetical protein